MNKKLSAFLKLADGLHFLIVFGVVNPPVTKKINNTAIIGFGNLSNKFNYRTSYPSKNDAHLGKL